MPYRLVPERLYINPTGAGPLDSAVGMQVSQMTMRLMGLLQTVIQLRPLIVTDAEYETMSGMVRTYFEPVSLADVYAGRTTADVSGGTGGNPNLGPLWQTGDPPGTVTYRMGEPARVVPQPDASRRAGHDAYGEILVALREDANGERLVGGVTQTPPRRDPNTEPEDL